jgi:hypothetical protein
MFIYIIDKEPKIINQVDSGLIIELACHDSQLYILKLTEITIRDKNLKPVRSIQLTQIEFFTSGSIYQFEANSDKFFFFIQTKTIISRKL